MFLLALLFVTLGQQQALPEAEVILDRMEAVFAPVEDFTVTLEGEISMDKVRVPKTTLTMYYKRPDKVHFESQSFSMLPRDGIAMSAAEIRRRYDAKTIAFIDTGGVAWYKVQLAAKDRETRLRQAYMYVDASDWTISRFESTPYEGRTLSFDFSYVTIEERFVVVSSVTATFGSVGPETDEIFQTPSNAPSPAVSPRDMQRRVRNGFVRFSYKDYRINTGLPDSLFAPAKSPESK